MKIKQTDILLISSLFILGIALCLIIYLPRRTSGNYVEVRVDGQVVDTFSLSGQHQETIHPREGGTNTFYINNGSVSMTDADCHDKVCVKMKEISRTGETIVCLPHKLVLAIVNRDEEPSLDAVTGGAP